MSAHGVLVVVCHFLCPGSQKVEGGDVLSQPLIGEPSPDVISCESDGV